MESPPVQQVTQQLAEFVAGLRYSDLPDVVTAKTVSLMLDAVGCALAGWGAEEIGAVVSLGRSLGAESAGTIIGSDEQSSLLGAVLTNGYLTTGITACDVYGPAHFHVTPEVIPAALAVAESVHATGEELLTAIGAGLEVACRIARSLDNVEFRRRGWHAPGVLGPIGAAAAAAKLLGLDATGVRRALALAFSQSSGTFASWPTTAVKFHQARGGGSGIIAAFLAREGLEAATEPLTAPDGGLYVSYGPGNGEDTVEDLGSDWELLNISVRLWPGATPIQALLTALLTGRTNLLPGVDEIESVMVRVAPRTYASHKDLARPTSTFEALLSFHFVAAAVLHANYFWIDLVGPGGYDNRRIQDFAANSVRLVADESVPMGGVAVEILTTSGARIDLEENAAVGTPTMPADPAQLHEKFLRGARARLSDAHSVRLLEALKHPQRYDDTANLTAQMRPHSDEPESLRAAGSAR
jgi:2-methylcitrate dehydratase PrpD